MWTTLRYGNLDFLESPHFRTFPKNFPRKAPPRIPNEEIVTICIINVVIRMPFPSRRLCDKHTRRCGKYTWDSNTTENEGVDNQRAQHTIKRKSFGVNIAARLWSLSFSPTFAQVQSDSRFLLKLLTKKNKFIIQRGALQWKILS